MKSICPTFQSLAIPAWRTKLDGNYAVDIASGCWLWNGRLDCYGYGIIGWRYGRHREMKRTTGAHRASWIVHRGPILPGLTIDHLCRNTICVNPDHMETVPNAENVRRSFRDRERSGAPAGRPRVNLEDRRGCAKHGKSDGRWYEQTRGYTAWVCRPCSRERLRRWHEGQADSSSGQPDSGQ